MILWQLYPILMSFCAADHLEELRNDLIVLSRPFASESIAVVRDVRRIPLKVVVTDDELEQAHLDSSYDGLHHFVPLDIMRIIS